MPQILQTTASLPLEALTYEPMGPLDGQGMPGWGSPVAFNANVMEQAGSSGWAFMTMPDGSQVRTPFTLYVPGSETSVPREGDRVEIDSAYYIVVERTAPRGLAFGRDAVDHYRLRLREE